MESVNISDVNTGSSVLDQETGTRSRSGLRADYSFDTRDSVFLTRRGTRIDFSPQIRRVGSWAATRRISAST